MTEWKKEKKFMEKKYHDFTMSNITIRDIHDENEVGYTVDEPYIYLSYENIITKTLKKKGEQKIFRLGVFIHETGHKIFSNFHILKNNLSKYDWFDKQIFMQISNIMEDPAIEWLISHIIPPFFQKCLKLHNQAIYNWSKPIEEGKTAFEQFLNALIQIGDGFQIKGEFTFKEAEMAFRETLPIMERCSVCKDVEKRFEYMEEVFEISKPLWKSIKESTEEEMKKFLQEILNLLTEMGIAIEENGDSGIIMPYIDESVPCPIQAASDANKKNNEQELSAEEIQELEKELELEIENNSIDMVPEMESPEDFNVKSPYFDNVRNKNRKVEYKPEYLNVYEKFISRYEDDIDAFYATLSIYFKKMPSKRKKSLDGKLNEERFLCKNSIRIFDRHKRNTEKQDIVIVIAVDLSGSMSGNKIKEAMKMAIIIAEASSMVGAKIYLYGFHTSFDTDSLLEHFISWENTEEERATLVAMKASGGNFDGYAIRYAGEILKEKKAAQKMLFVLHDGTPSGPYANTQDGLADVRDSVKEIKKYADVIGIAIECPNNKAFPIMYGEDYVRAEHAEQLSDILCERIIEKMEER